MIVGERDDGRVELGRDALAGLAQPAEDDPVNRRADECLVVSRAGLVEPRTRQADLGLGMCSILFTRLRVDLNRALPRGIDPRSRDAGRPVGRISIRAR